MKSDCLLLVDPGFDYEGRAGRRNKQINAENLLEAAIDSISRHSTMADLIIPGHGSPFNVCKTPLMGNCRNRDLDFVPPGETPTRNE